MHISSTRLIGPRVFELLATLSLLPAAASAQTAMVAVTPCSAGAFPATTCTIPATGQGHLIVVAWSSAYGTTPTISSVTDNAGNTYTEAGNARAVDSAAQEMVDIWYAKNSNSGATTITITPNPSGNQGAAVIWEFANADTASPLDQTAVLNSQSATQTPSASIAATAAGVVVSAMVPAASITGLHTGNLFTGDSLLYGVGWAHLVTSAAGTYTAQWDTSSAGTYAASTVSFKAAAGPGPSGACDLNQDGRVDILDTQLAINMAMGQAACTANIYGANVCNIIVVQRVTNAALGSPCVTGTHTVSLNWTASTSTNVAGYNVYRGIISGGPYTKINSSLVSGTTYVDNVVQSGQTYYYVTTAVDTGSNESVYSNEAQAVVPTP